jgi:hypothetical protein
MCKKLGLIRERLGFKKILDQNGIKSFSSSSMPWRIALTRSRPKYA